MVKKAKKGLGTILILDKDNPYHDWILFDLARRKGYPLRTVGADARLFNRLRYTRIIDKQEILYVKAENNEILREIKELKKVNRKRRMIAISAGDKKTRTRIQKEFDGCRIINFPLLREYKDKQELVEKVLGRWELECQNREIRKTLISNMIREPGNWENVLLLWQVRVYQSKNKKEPQKVNQEDIDELFPDSDFYQLESFIFSLIDGKLKQKTIKMAHYFLEVREYSPSWVVRKIREVFNRLGMFYQSYRGGVLIMSEHPRRVVERVQDLGWDHGLVLGEIEPYEQDQYLRVVKSVPYKHYLSIADLVYKVGEHPSENDVYELIEQIKMERVNTITDDDLNWRKYKRT